MEESVRVRTSIVLVLATRRTCAVPGFLHPLHARRNPSSVAVRAPAAPQNAQLRSKNKFATWGDDRRKPCQVSMETTFVGQVD